MKEQSTSEFALGAFQASIEYYTEGLRRCATADEPKWRERRDAAQAVVDALEAYEATIAKWRARA